MNNLALVSIVVPVYNVQKYIRECIDSILKQSYINIEIILVDDGSLDNSGNICDFYKRIDDRIKVIHKENGGLSSARNCGLEMVNGEYVLFVDSDDYLAYNAVEILLNFSKMNNLDMLHFDACNFCSDRKDINAKERYYIKNNCYPDIYLGAELYIKLKNNNEYRPPVQYYLYNTDFLKKNKLIFHDGIIHEDEEFSFMAFMLAQRVAHIPLTLYYHRLRNDSIMGMAWSQKNIDCLYIVITTIISKYNLFYTDLLQKQAFELGVYEFIKYFHFLMSVAENRNENKCKKELDEIKKKLADVNFFDNRELKSFFVTKVSFKIKNKIFIFVKRLLYQIKPIRKSISRYKMLYKDLDIVCRKTIKQLRTTKDIKDRIIILCVHHNHSNRGDIAIDIAQREYVEILFPNKTIVEVPTILCEKYSQEVNRYIVCTDLLLVSGGGWFGSLWRHNQMAAFNIISEHKKNKTVIFPQSIYYDKTDNNLFIQDKNFLRQMQNIFICLREKKSFDLVDKENYLQDKHRAVLVPDIALTYKFDDNIQKTNEVMLCLRRDVESMLSFEMQNELVLKTINRGEKIRFISSNQCDDLIGIDQRKQAVDDFLRCISRAKYIVTDRLHCMIFAAITSTPCIVLDNMTGKVFGVREWIGSLDYMTTINRLEDYNTAVEKVVNANFKWNRGDFLNNYAQLKSVLLEENII